MLSLNYKYRLGQLENIQSLLYQTLLHLISKGGVLYIVQQTNYCVLKNEIRFILWFRFSSLFLSGKSIHIFLMFRE
jgi:hypothetical protein